MKKCCEIVVPVLYIYHFFLFTYLLTSLICLVLARKFVHLYRIKLTAKSHGQDLRSQISRNFWFVDFLMQSHCQISQVSNAFLIRLSAQTPLHTFMSTAETLGQDPSPNPNSPKRGPNGPDETLASDIPPDPLLEFDNFINATATGGHRTPKPLRVRRSSDGASASLAAENSNGADPVTTTPTPENAASTAGAQPRPEQAAAPDWLPPGWLFEERVRSSGATAGAVDKVN
jgi:hypothetical protein